MESYKFFGPITALFIMFALLNCSSTVPKVDLALGSDPQAKLTEVDNRLNSARKKQYDLLSPNQFKLAEKALVQAHQKSEKGEPSEKVLSDIGQAMAHLQIVEEAGDRNAAPLSTVLTARGFAANAKADSVLPKEFLSADKELRSFGEDMEDKNYRPESEDISELEGRYSQLELLALKHTNLGAARSLIEKAEKNGAKRNAPVSYNDAQVQFDSAARAIEANRRNPEAYQTQVNVSKVSAEKLNQVQKTVVGSKTSETAAIQIYDQQRQLASNRVSLQASEAKEHGDRKNIQALQGLNQTYADKEALNQKIEQIKAEFNPSEADVLRDGNKIIIRLKSMQFASARSELTTSSLDTLQKVKEMIAAVPVSKVMVEGHTDSIGGSSKNMELSQKRAEAVKKYFIAEKTLLESQLEAKGYGYEKPLTTNKTKEGRATNRRVDVVIETNTAI